MSKVILSPTWKLIPSTVSWPEKSAFTYPDGFFDEVEYDIAIKNVHLVDIAEEDWNMVAVLTFKEIKPDTVYSIDAKFEVNPEMRGPDKLARLVKPKEKPKSQMSR